MAKRLLDTPANEYGIHEITGEDISIGGEFYKLNYDQKIPKFLNKYGKQWGARVGETEIGTGNQGGKPIDDGAGGVVRVGGTPKHEKVHSIDVTPEMKKSVLHEGQPIARTQPPPKSMPYTSAPPREMALV